MCTMIWHKLYWSRCIRLFLNCRHARTQSYMGSIWRLNRQFLHSMALHYIKRIQLLSLNNTVRPSLRLSVVFFFFSHLPLWFLHVCCYQAAMIAYFFVVSVIAIFIFIFIFLHSPVFLFVWTDICTQRIGNFYPNHFIFVLRNSVFCILSILYAKTHGSQPFKPFVLNERQ